MSHLTDAVVDDLVAAMNLSREQVTGMVDRASAAYADEERLAIRELMPCTCGEPETSGVIHYRERPCHRDERLQRATARTDAFLAAHPRTHEELTREYDEWERDELARLCDLCQRALDRDEQTVEVLENGGEPSGNGRHVCVECALDRPTVLLPALRSVGEYDVPNCQQCGHARTTVAHITRCEPNRIPEIAAELETVAEGLRPVLEATCSTCGEGTETPGCCVTPDGRGSHTIAGGCEVSS